MKINERTAELSQALSREKELNELKSKFVSMASHEFRTPLSTVMSSISLVSMYKDNRDYDKLDKHINRVKSSVNHLIHILNDFLSLGKLDEGKVTIQTEEFDLTEFVGELVEEVGLLLKDGQKIEVKYQAPHRLVRSDPQILKSLLFNLLSNASKYSDVGKFIRITCKAINGRLIFYIHDEGIGIPESEQKHLFDRFFRASNASNIQGTGLGLNIVKRYVDLLSGDISFTSEYGKGTTFEVSIPYADGIA